MHAQMVSDKPRAFYFEKYILLFYGYYNNTVFARSVLFFFPRGFLVLGIFLFSFRLFVFSNHSALCACFVVFWVFFSETFGLMFAFVPSFVVLHFALLCFAFVFGSDLVLIFFFWMVFVVLEFWIVFSSSFRKETQLSDFMFYLVQMVIYQGTLSRASCFSMTKICVILPSTDAHSIVIILMQTE